jgi:UDP-N-acetylglucosamine 2-epimerase
MSLLLTYGTRPEYIKIKPLILELSERAINFKTLFTGQHKDIANFGADYNFQMTDLVQNRLNNVISNCLSIPEEFFYNITHVLVQGDTTSALGIALNAFNRKIKIIHLEAGLRTYDFDNPYPEEANRQLISRIADINLCPTNINMNNLLSEGIGKEKIHVVGNTVLDNLINYKKECEYTNKVLVTLHRRENHDMIKDWFTEINDLAKTFPELEFILPIHPNPNVQKHKNILTNIRVIEPLTHNELLTILVKVKLVITDSGGLQEECSFFNKKCLVCRKITERPESIGTHSFIVESPNELVRVFNNHIINYKVNFPSPYGDGEASKKICEILKKI